MLTKIFIDPSIVAKYFHIFPSSSCNFVCACSFKQSFTTSSDMSQSLLPCWHFGTCKVQEKSNEAWLFLLHVSPLSLTCVNLWFSELKGLHHQACSFWHTQKNDWQHLDLRFVKRDILRTLYSCLKLHELRRLGRVEPDPESIPKMMRQKLKATQIRLINDCECFWQI